MALSRLSIDLGVNLAEFESDIGRAAGILKKDVEKMERQVNGFARAAGVALGGAVVAGFVQATRAAVDFERSMAEVSTLLDDTSSLDSMTESVKDLSKEFGKAPTEQAAALYQIISSGAEAGAEAVEILTATNKLAVGGITDLKTAADGLTSVMNVYGNEAGSVTDISDKFFAAMKAGKTTVGELAGSIGPVISISKELGVSFDELIAAGSTLTLSGNTTSQSFNALKAALSNVVKPSKDAVDIASELGIEFNAAAVQSMGLAGFLGEVQDAAGGNVEIISKLFGSVEGLNAVLALTGSSSEDFARILDNIQNAAGETDKAVSKMQETASQAFARLSATIKVELVEAGAVILDTLVPAIKLLADNIDLIINLIKSFAALLAGVYINRVLLAAATTGQLTSALGLLRVAFIALGGPVVLTATAIASVVTGYQRMQQIMADANQDIGQSTKLLIGQADALQGVANATKLAALTGDLAQKYKDLGKELAASRAEYQNLAKAYYDSINLSGENSQQTQLLAAEMASLEQHVLTTRKVYEAYGKELQKTEKYTEDNAKAIKKQAQEVLSLEEKLKRLSKMQVEVRGLTLDQKDWVERLTEEYKKAYEEQEKYNEALQTLRDIGDPIAALLREFNDQQKTLNKALADGRIDAIEYQRIINTLTDSLGKTAAATMKVAEETDLMKEAMLESVRILERTFTDIWQNIASGSQDAFDGVEEGFQAMIASINAAASRKITLQVEAALQGQDVDFRALGEGLLQFAAVIAGSKLGGGGPGAAAGAATGAAIGSLFPGWGTVIGAAAGGILGGQADSDAFWTEHGGSFVDSLFGDYLPNGDLLGLGIGDSIARSLLGIERPAVLQITGFDTSSLSKSDSDAVLRSVFGDTFLRSRRLDASQLGSIEQALDDFDKTIASFISEDQIMAISESLKEWGLQMDGAEISIEALLDSRLDVVLEHLSESARGFAEAGQDLEERLDRLGVALSVEKLFGTAPEELAGRTVDQFLAVVESFQTGAKSITEAFEEVLSLFDLVVSVKRTLQDFASSNLEADFNQLLHDANITLTEAVAGMSSGLMDAINAFNGSPEDLERIGSIIMSLREGEIKLLSQIDAIQKGINANLNQLQAEILGLTAVPKTGADFFNEARDLVQQVLNAGSIEDVAAIQQQFNALIRSISEEDQIRLQQPILQLIESFRAASNDMVGDFRDNALESAESIRDLVDVFSNDIGDPLAIIAATNERAAAALEAISASRDPAEPVDPLEPVDGTIGDTIISANALAAETQQRIMEEGLREIARTMADGSGVTAAALANAIRNADFRVVVELRPNDLNTR